MSTATPAHPEPLLPRVLSALREAGHDPDQLDPEALARFEHLHTLGRWATAALADACAITASDHVLDVGCGVAGPARHLARLRGCRVVGVDLTTDFLAVAADLNARLHLSGRVSVCAGDAVHLPFAASTFDVVWTQHVAMNIADKSRLYHELRRVIRPGGRLGLFDIVAGECNEGVIHLPVPWATDSSQNHLVPATAIRALLEDAGFRVTVFEDSTYDEMGPPPPPEDPQPLPPPPWAVTGRARRPAAAAHPSPLGLHLIMGGLLPVKVANAERNFDEGRIRLLRCVAVADGR
ncbi:MAG TPA: class I SAM-dependent methyltransferase [Acidimicrobiales bacterium]|nr:class I SAM-dependent methyltransferase [Acidimicrobiales bacterium]